jgi:hypothetical protein
MATPFHLDLVLRPGETFGPYVFLALDPFDNLMDLTGYTAFAQFRETPQQSLVLDLDPQLIDEADIGTFTVTTPNSKFTCTGHGLIAGQIVNFSSDGTLPTPLDDATDYFVMSYGLTANAFYVELSPGSGAAVILTDTGTGTHSASTPRGQIYIPEIDHTDTTVMAEKSGGWDFLLEDPLGRRFDSFGGGKFTIAKGYTTPTTP